MPNRSWPRRSLLNRFPNSFLHRRVDADADIVLVPGAHFDNIRFMMMIRLK
jgi:hypothetical protein